MDDTAGMRVVERGGDGRQHPLDVLDRERLAEQRGQCAAVDVLGDDVRHALLLAIVKNCQHVWMPQPGNHDRLALKALAEALLFGEKAG
jgi:hypothetical protein